MLPMWCVCVFILSFIKNVTLKATEDTIAKKLNIFVYTLGEHTYE